MRAGYTTRTRNLRHYYEEIENETHFKCDYCPAMTEECLFDADFKVHLICKECCLKIRNESSDSHCFSGNLERDTISSIKHTDIYYMATIQDMIEFEYEDEDVNYSEILAENENQFVLNKSSEINKKYRTLENTKKKMYKVIEYTANLDKIMQQRSLLFGVLNTTPKAVKIESSNEIILENTNTKQIESENEIFVTSAL